MFLENLLPHCHTTLQPLAKSVFFGHALLQVHSAVEGGLAARFQPRQTNLNYSLFSLEIIVQYPQNLPRQAHFYGVSVKNILESQCLDKFCYLSSFLSFKKQNSDQFAIK